MNLKFTNTVNFSICKNSVPGGFANQKLIKIDLVFEYTYSDFGPDYAEKRKRMGPGGHFCRSDNAPQDGDSAGAAHSHRRHPAPNAGPRHPPHFCRQQPSNGSRRRSRLVRFGDIWQPIYHLGLRSWLIPQRRESVVTPSAHLSSRGEIGAKRLPAPKRSPLCLDAGPLWRSRARGCGVNGANLVCVHRHTPHQTSIHIMMEKQLVNFSLQHGSTTMDSTEQ